MIRELTLKLKPHITHYDFMLYSQYPNQALGATPYPLDESTSLIISEAVKTNCKEFFGDDVDLYAPVINTFNKSVFVGKTNINTHSVCICFTTKLMDNMWSYSPEITKILFDIVSLGNFIDKENKYYWSDEFQEEKEYYNTDDVDDRAYNKHGV